MKVNRRQYCYQNGQFVDRASGKRLPTAWVKVGGVVVLKVKVKYHYYRADSLIYFSETARWFDDFSYLDDDTNNFELSNIAPYSPVNVSRHQDADKPVIGIEPASDTVLSGNDPGVINDEDAAEPEGLLRPVTIDADKLAEHLLYDDGHFYLKVDGSRLDAGYTVDGVLRSCQSILYFIVTSEWYDTFIELEPSSNQVTFDTLLPSEFVISPVEGLTLGGLEHRIELDPDDESLYWRDSPKVNGLVNSILGGKPVIFEYNGTVLANIFGNIYPGIDFYKAFMGLIDPDDFPGLSLESPGSSEGIASDAAAAFGRRKVMRCFYCGDDSQITRDHVVPISAAAANRSYHKKDTVLCCRECNTLLGNKWLTTVEERACYLAERLSSRYQSSLIAFEYSEQELNEFGHHLRSMAQANLYQKHYVMQRIDHCHKIAGSLYSPEDVSHLRGLTTDAKRVAYGILDDFFYGPARPLEEFVDHQSRRLSEPPEIVQQILEERIHISVAIQFKYDHRFRMDRKILDLWRLLRQGKLKL